jgi:hypothetical protein
MGKQYAYRLTEKGARVGAMFILFHKRICGPLANSLFHHRPPRRSPAPAKIETATYRKTVVYVKGKNGQWLNINFQSRKVHQRCGSAVHAHSVLRADGPERQRDLFGQPL